MSTPVLPLFDTSKSVGEVFKVVGGGTPTTANRDYWKGPIPWVTSADLDADLGMKPRKTVSHEAIALSATNLVPAGSVIVATRVGLGKVGIAPVDLCFSQDCQGLIVDTKVCDSKFAALQLKLRVQTFKHISRGTTISGVTKKQLLDVPFDLPPLDGQRRIVAEIEKQFTRLDAGVAALQRVQSKLKRYRAAVLKAACEGRLVPTEAELAREQGRDYESAEVLLQRILTERRAKWNGRAKYSEPVHLSTLDLAELPEGWVWAKAEQLCGFITKGTTPSSSKMQAGAGDVQFIKVYNLTFSGHLNLSYKPIFVSRETHTKELARSGVTAGDVLINIVGPPLGQVSIVPDEIDEANINQAIARFRPVLPASRSFIALCLMAQPIISWAMKRAKTTAGQSNLTLELCRDLPIPLPPHAEQERIVVEVERRLSVVEELEATVTANLQRAARLRQAILQKAFNGYKNSQNV